MKTFSEFTLNEDSRYRYLPVRKSPQISGAYEVDPTYSGDAFELERNEVGLLDSRKARVVYYSELRDKYDTKRKYIHKHPKWEGEMINVNDIDK